MINRDNLRKVVMFVLLILATVSIIALAMYRPHAAHNKKISLIVYGNNVKRWESLLQGAELAGEEKGAEINLVSMGNETDYEEQIRIIEREVSNGTQAILLAACNSEKIGEYLDRAKMKIPVIFVETGVDLQEDGVCIAADDYMMGYELGKSICENEKPIAKVAIVSDKTYRNSISEREKGVRDAIKDYSNTVVTWKRNPNEENLLPRVFLQRELVSEAVDVIVTLDNTMTDSLMDALSNLNKTSKVYSISTSEQAVYCLDHNLIKSLTYQNEFGIGYISTMYAIDGKDAHKEYSDNDISFKVVNKDNMYEYDNQKLLFPFVK